MNLGQKMDTWILDAAKRDAARVPKKNAVAVAGRVLTATALAVTLCVMPLVTPFAVWTRWDWAIGGALACAVALWIAGEQMPDRRVA